jgi:hypothetical protein
MRVTTRRRRGLGRLGAALVGASALATALTGAPANAATTASVPRASGTASSAGTLPNNTYTWLSVNSLNPRNVFPHMCLAYDPEAKGGARQEGCASGDNTLRWNVVNTGDDRYEFINVNRGQCLTVAGGSKADGAATMVFPCHGGDEQLFTLKPVGVVGGIPQPYEIVNYNSGKCVSVGAGRFDYGAGVIQWTCAETAAQVWLASLAL